MPARLREARRPYHGRRVVLGVTGGIAAYKAIQLARDLTQAGAEVDVVLTNGALEFVQPLSFEALTGRPAHVSMYVPGEPLTHIQLARDASLILVAPATANFIARAAAGMADDLLTAVLLATDAPVLVCPAMNDRMYAHPATRRNLVQLEELGYHLGGPADGPLAWGEGEGPGRLLDLEEILEEAGRLLEAGSELNGKRVIVTAGPTREAIDPVRFIGNRSSGRMGYAIAAAARRRGARVLLITGPTSIPTPTGCEVLQVESAEEMRSAVARELPDADALVMAAAVADFRPTSAADQKIKKNGDGLAALQLESTEDVLISTRDRRKADAVIVGFALETHDAVVNGRSKLERKGLDLVVVNDAMEAGAGFEVSTNRVTILSRDGGQESLALMSKASVADEILDRVEALLPARRE
ncbi:bifunctional phosphopantothenoylcysteine decarboxylase/phosphopantothenate--cysteine ligase CoaBC [soil metagenome]